MGAELSAKQRAYRKYLKTDHWESLRVAALQRDGGKCVICGSDRNPHVHHTFYRERPELSLLEDLVTLCKRCHQYDHGYGHSAFEWACDDLKRKLGKDQFPTQEELLHVVKLCDPKKWDERKKVQAIIREISEMRVGQKRLSVWRQNSAAVTRFWHWAERRFDQLRQQVERTHVLR